MDEPATAVPATRPHVVILGGGFGGLAAARELGHAPVSVTLLDRRNHHLFQPLLYQVATASLNASDIAEPIRKVLQDQPNTEVLLANVDRIDVEGRTLTCADGEVVPYDYLIVAAGATHSYFGHDEWEAYAPSMKSIEDALDVRRRLLIAFEAAERSKDPADRDAWLTFVIVGGGPTGVELAGSLAEMARHALTGEFRHIDPATARVILIEGLDRVLPGFPPKLSEWARRDLVEMGVQVQTGTLVKSIDEGGVDLEGDRIEARTVLWAAGVRASPLGESLGAPLDRSGRVIVEPDLSLPGHPEVFVVGDLALVTQDGKPVPGVAQGALQGGSHAAACILAALAGQPSTPFRYRDKGMLAAIGRAAAVANLPHKDLTGFSAWLIWAVVHIYFLIGFRNRLFVMAHWSWAFLTHDRGARLITGSATVRSRWEKPRH
ncbi:MAG TPA: NAD(P)/FAD-dependent oxidoreductase [Actinomycetota bacterium]|nr:NAD(P)/FAD-dependent oxidoreductase [Actinomycetota bacterium]